MKQTATVVIIGGVPMAEIVRPEACEACHACKYGRQEVMRVDLPNGDYRAGESVELTLPEGRVGAASLIAYGFPLVFLLIGLFVGHALTGTDFGAAIGALLMLAVSLLAIKLLEPRLRQSGAFRPETCPDARPYEPPTE